MLAVAEGDDHTHWDLAAAVFDAIPGQRKRWHVVPRSGHLTMYEDEAAVAVVAAGGGRLVRGVPLGALDGELAREQADLARRRHDLRRELILDLRRDP